MNYRSQPQTKRTMKSVLILSAILLSTVCFAQTQPQFKKYERLKTTKPNTVLEEDNPLRVIYQDRKEEEIRPAIFVNGTFVGSLSLIRIPPEYIEKLNVEKGSFEINKVRYPAKLLIETKAGYTPSFISLNDFKKKYIGTREKSVVFQIDDEIVQGDYDKYLIDENYVLKAIVKRVKIKNQKMNFTLIHLLAKSEKNIKDSKRIMIRGQGGVASL